MNIDELKKFISLYLLSGISIMPVKKDKIPVLLGWTDDSFSINESEMFAYADKGYQVGIITGKKSGITVIDIDFVEDGKFGTDPSIFPDTYTIRTPSGALQKYYQYDARMPQSQLGFAPYPKVDIRNDGGQVVAPPSSMDYIKSYASASKHIVGSYEIVSGSIADLAPFPFDLFKEIIALKIDDKDVKSYVPQGRPGDDFDKDVSWDDLLSAHGWKRAHTDRKGSTHWVRPGKDGDATSATTRVTDDGRDRLFVFSTNADPFVPYDKDKKNSYTKFSAFATLHHDGDFSLAATALKEQGYGESAISLAIKRGIETPKLADSDEKMDLICLDDVMEEPIDWVWSGKIARGELCIIAGEPGAGKTMIVVDIAARISKGSALPLTTECISNGIAGNVIFLTSENDPAKVLRPRLFASGADLKKIHLLSSSVNSIEKGKKKNRHVALSEDAEKIGNAVASIPNVVALIIDPISEYMGKKDANNNADVRDVLATLTDHVRGKNVAIIAITHYNKKVEITSASARINGSIGFAGAARTAFAVGKFFDDRWSDEEKAQREGQMAFSSVKNNLSGDKGGYVYKITPFSYEKNGVYIDTAHIIWVEEITESADELLQRSNDKMGRPRRERDKCKDWLEDYLNNSPDGAKRLDIEDAGRAKGHTRATIDRASKELLIDKSDGVWKLQEF